MDFHCFFYLRSSVLLITVLTWHAVDINAQQCPQQSDGNATMMEGYTEDLFRHEINFSISWYKYYAQQRVPLYSFSIATVSLFMGLSRLRYGATGETSQELCEYLHVRWANSDQDRHGYQRLADIINSISDSGIRLDSQIFYQSDLKLKNQYERIMKCTFRENMQELERNSIVEWYARQIPINRTYLRGYKDYNGPGFVVATAGYFDHTWTDTFSECKEDMMFSYGNSSMNTTSAYQKIGRFNYGDFGNAKFVEITRQTKEPNITISVFIILPNEGIPLQKVEQEMNETTIRTELFKGGNKTKVRITLPEFRVLIGQLELDESVLSLGLSKIFNDTAEFSGITAKHPARVQVILHNNHVQSTYKQKEKADCHLVPLPPSTVEFKVDRPYIMIIATKPEPSVILFIARMTGDLF